MKILLSTGFDEASTHAIDYAINLFSSDAFTKVEYHLMHAYHGKDEDEKEAQQKLGQESARIAQKIGEHKTYFHQGSIKHVVNSYVDEHGIDLVVMGGREKDRTQDPIMPSNAMEISTHAKCSVLVIPKNLDVTAKPEVIAFGSDYHMMDVPREALLILKNLLKGYHAKLKVFHVYEEGDVAALQTEMESNLKQHFIERADHEYHPVINHDTIDGVLSFIRNETPDILTLIPRERTFMEEMHHPSVTKQLSYEAKIPLLVLR